MKTCEEIIVSKYKNIELYEVHFYLTDDDGNAKVDLYGDVQLYHCTNFEAVHIDEDLTIEDLKEI